MRSDPYFIVWKIEADSAELLRQACDAVNSAIDVGGIAYTVYAGNSSQREEHSFASYFERVCIIPGTNGDKNSQRLFIQRKSDSGRFWKDVMVSLLNNARRGEEVHVNLDYRVDDERVHETAARIPTWFSELSSDAQDFWIASAEHLLVHPTFSFAELRRATDVRVNSLKSMHRNSYRAIHRAHSPNPLWSSWDHELQCNFYKMEPVVRDMILSLAVSREGACRIVVKPAA